MIDLEKIERELSHGKLYICREGPERWAGGMAGPESTYVPIDYSPDVVLALVARIRELEARARKVYEVIEGHENDNSEGLFRYEDDAREHAENLGRGDRLASFRVVERHIVGRP